MPTDYQIAQQAPLSPHPGDVSRAKLWLRGSISIHSNGAMATEQRRQFGPESLEETNAPVSRALISACMYVCVCVRLCVCVCVCVRFDGCLVKFLLNGKRKEAIGVDPKWEPSRSSFSADLPRGVLVHSQTMPLCFLFNWVCVKQG